jgi:alkylated DNA repair dioxygenase AlkB
VSYQPPPSLIADSILFPGVHGLLRVPNFLQSTKADHLLAHCLHHISWEQERFWLYGKIVTAPRLSAWCGEPGVMYRYSGVSRHAKSWDSRLRCLSHVISDRLCTSFNFILANRYRNGNDYVGWHADNERGLGPVIASLSLGETRVFRAKEKKTRNSVGIRIEHGDLLMMWGRFQQDFKHTVPRTTKPVGERVNLTLRWVSS